MKTEAEIKKRLEEIEKRPIHVIDPEVTIVARDTYIRALKWVLDIPEN